jgi:hypothetical protein
VSVVITFMADVVVANINSSVHCEDMIDDSSDDDNSITRKCLIGAVRGESGHNGCVLVGFGLVHQLVSPYK